MLPFVRALSSGGPPLGCRAWTGNGRIVFLCTEVAFFAVAAASRSLWSVCVWKMLTCKMHVANTHGLACHHVCVTLRQIDNSSAVKFISGKSCAAHEGRLSFRGDVSCCCSMRGALLLLGWPVPAGRQAASQREKKRPDCGGLAANAVASPLLLFILMDSSLHPPTPSLLLPSLPPDSNNLSPKKRKKAALIKALAQF